MTSLSVTEFGRVSIGPSGFTRQQTKALLAAAKAHPVARGDGENIVYERNGHLFAGQMVGVLSAPGCSLEILPKIDPLTHAGRDTVRNQLVQMLDVALDLKIGAGHGSPMVRGASSLLDILIWHFADGLLTQTRRGLPRMYIGRQNELPALRGRLDVRRQFSTNASRPDRLACRYDALVEDTPLLQLMKACVMALIPSARRIQTRRLLEQLRIIFADVSDVRPSRHPKIELDRSNNQWRGLLELARLLLGRDWQDIRRDQTSPHGLSLLFPMNDLFEGYVTALARRALGSLGIEVKSQAGGAFCLEQYSSEERSPGPKLFATRPDLMFYRGTNLVAIVDTKWKMLGSDPADPKRGVSQADVYQLMAYAQLYKVDRLLLLYPFHLGLGCDGLQVRHRINVPGGATLEIATVDVTSTRQSCQQALQRLLLPLCVPALAAA